MREAIEKWLDKKDIEQVIETEAYILVVASMIEECMADIGPKWVSVADELPELAIHVLGLFTSGESMVIELLTSAESYDGQVNPLKFWNEPFYENMDIEWEEITHWMPLPKAPD